MAAQARAGRPPGPEIALDKLAFSADMNGWRNSDRRSGPALVADACAWGTYAWTSVVSVTGIRLGGGTDEFLKTPSRSGASAPTPCVRS